MTGFHFGSSIDLFSETVDDFIHLNYYKQGQLEITVVACGGDPRGVQSFQLAKDTKERRCL